MNTKTLSDITTERARQDRKWGEQNHRPLYWLAIIAEELAEVGGEISGLFPGPRFPTTCQQFAATVEHLGNMARKTLDVTDIPAHKVNAERYRKELVEVAACAIAAIESLDRNEEATTAEVTGD